MKNKLFLLLICLVGFYSCFAQNNNEIVIDDDIQLIHIQDSIYVHVTWHSLENYGRFSSNGMIIIKNGKAIMIDTPMDNDKTERLTVYLRDSMGVKVEKLIAGHFHDDCLGGLEYLQSIGVESIANKMTADKCKELKLPIPSFAFSDSLIFDFNGKKIECRFFGAGHSFDNIIVWIPGEKILFGGCLIKSINSKNLGNLSDAVVTDWASTVKKIIDAYPEINFVVPGHGETGGKELLYHTVKLVELENKPKTSTPQ